MIATVKYGQMSLIGNFKADVNLQVKINDECIIHTDRGTEMGTVVCKPLEVADEQSVSASVGKVIRKITPPDMENFNKIQNDIQPKEQKYCEEKIEQLKLDMKLVAVEHILGGEKIIFYFLANGRIDFRELVKELAREYKTRIEMRQIGVRDEARLLSDFEHCGRPLCCKTFIKELEPVTMKMAKSQKTTLDPSKISGMCGRLMCCLRYEDTTYTELKKQMPQKGAKVRIENGEGEVIDVDLISDMLTVELASGEKAGEKVKVRKGDILQIISDGFAQEDGGGK